MDLWCATTNKHKLIEFQSITEGLPIKFHTPDELLSYYPPPETGKTFYENARIKAKSLHAIKSDQWVMAEDSGLCVPGLQGNPGVYSARYAGENATDVENNQKLLHMLKIRSPTQRDASFIAALVLFSPEGEEFRFDGELKGKITDLLKGDSGFGYDPLFVPTLETKTLAELGQTYKNKVSHRAQCIRQLLDFFRQRKILNSL